MQLAVVPVFLYREFNSDLALNLLWVTTVVPFSLLAVSGSLADEYNRWTILIIVQWVALVQALFLAVIAFVWTGRFNTWVVGAVMALNFLSSTISAFESPARIGLKSEFVPGELLTAALKYYSAVGTLSWRIGLGVGGLLIVFTREFAPICFLLNAASYLLGVAALLIMRPSLRGTNDQIQTEANVGLWLRACSGSKGLLAKHLRSLSLRQGVKFFISRWQQTMKEGFRVIKADKKMCLLIGQTLLVILFLKRYEAFLPAYAKEQFGDVNYAGWLRFAMSVGAIFGFAFTQFMVKADSSFRVSHRATMALTVAVLALPLFAKDLLATARAMAVVAAILIVQESCCVAAFQSRHSKSIQSRISACRGTMISATEVFALPLATAAATFGLRPVITVCAILGFLLAVPLTWLAERCKPVLAQTGAVENVQEASVCS
jgi:hypothetical protein